MPIRHYSKYLVNSIVLVSLAVADAQASLETNMKLSMPRHMALGINWVGTSV